MSVDIAREKSVKSSLRISRKTDSKCLDGTVTYRPYPPINDE